MYAFFLGFNDDPTDHKQICETHLSQWLSASGKLSCRVEIIRTQKRETFILWITKTFNKYSIIFVFLFYSLHFMLHVIFRQIDFNRIYLSFVVPDFLSIQGRFFFS